ncbi:prolyl oligopeptidase family serine peptidase [Nocardia sp. ET3-3]|uniref:Prolyl oligopeptidase family serine peptidase n=1 Tax=Nocardia terrae TaxID=2675851 RepID=A0A7K1V4F6_9NOCA|nr:alpha/beta hydrolase [Nocardia terrae]MVU81496.1 prolyl oligopeptidase family serine peptidase [Nocardia terrae]
MGIRGAVVAMAVALAMGTAGTAAAEPAFEHTDFTFQFGDFTGSGELDYPSGVRNAPVVVLIPGSSPEDLNADMPTGSHIFLDIANDLTSRGYAVMRYNKRYVHGPGDVDAASYWTKLDLHGMRDDAEQVLRAAEQDSHVDPHRVFVYGWSEGSTVAASLATTHPELAGSIFQGPVALPWRVTFGYQGERVYAPYLASFAVNGLLGPDELAAAAHGDGGAMAKAALTFACVDASNGDFTVNPKWDLNRDGKLDVNLEFRPAYQFYLESAMQPGGWFQIYNPARALPSVIEQAPNLTAPVLILQGAEDANVPPSAASTLDTALTAAGNRDHTLHLFPGLGHSLGRTPDVLHDNFQPIDQTALDTLAEWLDARR